jgi:hypothetical protein
MSNGFLGHSNTGPLSDFMFFESVTTAIKVGAYGCRIFTVDVQFVDRYPSILFNFWKGLRFCATVGLNLSEIAEQASNELDKRGDTEAR